MKKEITLTEKELQDIFKILGNLPYNQISVVIDFLRLKLAKQLEIEELKENKKEIKN